MNLKIKFSGLIIAAFTLLSCYAPSAQNGAVITDIDVPEFLEKSKDKNSILLDVRTAGEVSGGVIPGAVNIDYYSSDFKQQISKLDTSKTVLVYCKMGGRSSAAAKILASSGFKKVYNLNGGYTAYSNYKK